MACTTEELSDRFFELIVTQYGGDTAVILDEAIEKELPVSFAIYPNDEGSVASDAQYEYDLYNVTATSLRDFAAQLAQATYDLYVTNLCVDLVADDIICVDVIS